MQTRVEAPLVPAKLAEVHFALFAPRNESVELLPEWNQFRPFPMARGDDGWWRARAQLPDGAHRYRFRVKSRSYFAEGEPRDICDPYGLEVSTENGEEYSLFRLKNGRRQWVDYAWQHDNVPLPTNDKLVIYELHIGDFTGTHEHIGTFELAISRLDYLRDLGINAIQLMPVKESPGRQWGYSLKSLFGIDHGYGTPEDLCRLVDECHARGIRVILDVVFNHTHPDSWLAQIDYEYWFHRHNPDGKDMDWGPKFNYGFYDEALKEYPARKYVFDAIRFMVEKYHIDGLRFDATAAIRDFGILREMSELAYGMIAERKPFICIAEHVPEDPAVTGRERGAPMDAAWHEWLGRVLQSLIARRDIDGVPASDLGLLLSRLDPKQNGYGSAYRTITYIGTHDHKRPMQIIGEDGQTFGEAAFRRMKLGHGLLLAMPGIPHLWMGSEFGFASEKKLDPCPLDWSLLNNPDNSDLLEFHRRLITARRDISALTSESFEVVLKDDVRQILAVRRCDEKSECMVLANFRDEDCGDISLETSPGRYRDVISADTIDIVTGQPITLGPSQVRLLTKS